MGYGEMNPIDPVTFCGQFDDRLKRAKSEWIVRGQILTGHARTLPPEWHREGKRRFICFHSGTRLRFLRARVAYAPLGPETQIRNLCALNILIQYLIVLNISINDGGGAVTVCQVG